ncbi:MAG: peroxiredoxin-like family protein [Phycisphaerales bacterium JB052]
MNKAALYASIAMLPVFAFAPLTMGAPESQPAAKLAKLDQPLGVSDTIPMFTVSDASSKDVHDLAKLLDNGPVVVTFFRGSWCPYCVGELNDLQKNLEDITSAGATVLAISPEKPSETADLIEQKKLGFLFGTDHENELATKLALSFELDATTVEKYKKYGIDVGESNGSDVWQLPIPATYIIDTDGTIAWSYVDENYRNRPDYKKVVKQLQKMQDDS